MLTRFVLDYKSECALPPLSIGERSYAPTQNINQGCWHPKSFDKALIVIVDALRYDFTIPHSISSPGGSPDLYHDALPFFYETTIREPENAFLLPFIADPPTTTLQRLKGLMTGTLPTFVDAGSNFAGTAIEEDNLVAQLRSAGKSVAHLGDDTWHALFPGHFNANLTHKYDSFNVWDLHTVDNGVTEHLMPLLHPNNVTKWDVLIGHYLGVDHAGHRYGPNHTAMTAKLQQMDGVFRQIVELLDDNTLLVAMGDHGMDAKGDHGGESDDEVQAALWMYSKKGIFGRSSPRKKLPPATARERSVGQIDLVPTLSLLLGLPIPFNNLGAPIEEAFIGAQGDDWENIATVNRLAAAQVHRYQHEYAVARGLDSSTTSQSLALWDEATEAWRALSGSSPSDVEWKETSLKFRSYQEATLEMCKKLWARFDIPSMYQGIAILAAGVAILISFGRGLSGDVSELCPLLVARLALGTAVGLTAGLMAATLLPTETSLVDWALLGSAGGGILGFSSAMCSLRARMLSVVPCTLWGWFALIFTLSQTIGFASNSFTIWEDEILLFFISTFGVLALVSSARQSDRSERILGCYHSILFIVITRMVSLARLCREEQMPFCRSTYYASINSSTSATWQLFIPYIVALLLPGIIKSYYQTSRNYEGPAPLWVGFVLRIALLLIAIFWTLDAADDGNWVPSLDQSLMKTIRMGLAQFVLCLSLVGGTSYFIYAAPCVRILRASKVVPPTAISTTPTSSSKASTSHRTPNPLPKSISTLTILGFSNSFGTHNLLLLVSMLPALHLLQKPMGHFSLSLLTLQILSLLSLLPSLGRTISTSALPPVLLAMMGNYYFLKTGHQSTLSSIQWESAFIPFRTITYPWSPMLVIANTFGAQILTAAAVPLVVLWGREVGREAKPSAVAGSIQSTFSEDHAPTSSPGKGVKGLLGETARAASAFLAYHATINLGTTVFAGWLRRHLMLYRIFAPRWMVGGGVLLVVDIVLVGVGLGLGLGVSVGSVAEVFGWI